MRRSCESLLSNGWLPGVLKTSGLTGLFPMTRCSAGFVHGNDSVDRGSRAATREQEIERLTRAFARAAQPRALRAHPWSRAGSDEELPEIPRGNPLFVFCLIHEFNQPVREPYSERDNIIVISRQMEDDRMAHNSPRSEKAGPRSVRSSFDICRP